MATVIKKISELEHLEELTSSSNVIIEENGEAKLFPAASLGSAEMPEITFPVTSVNGMTGDVVIEVGSGSGAGSSVQSDYNQNDPTAADYIKNRPFYMGDLVETEMLDVNAFLAENGLEWIPMGDDTVDGTNFLWQRQFICALKDGKEYSLVINGNKYTTIADSINVWGYDSIYIGDAEALYNDDLENFTYLVEYVPEYDVSVIVYKSPEAPTECKIYSHEREIVKLDPKYLPEGGVGYTEKTYTPETFDILQIMNNLGVEFEELTGEDSTNGKLKYEMAFGYMEPLISFIPDSEYTVAVNGVSYTGLAADFSDMAGYPSVTIGDLDAMMSDDFSNVRYFMAVEQPEEGVYEYYLMLDAEAFGLTEAPTEFTISGSAVTEIIHKIDSKYLPEQVKSDWNENDPNAEGYIANRPFYEAYIAEDVLLEERTFEDISFVEFSEQIDLVEGEVYIVTFDGKQYNCVAWSDDYSYLGGKNEPFLLYCKEKTTCLSVSVSGTHTIKIESAVLEVAKKIDKKFLPDDVGGGQADWNQNDETAPDYIKNRPFSSETFEEEVVVVPEQTFNTKGTSGHFTLSDSKPLTDGKAYTVVFNGQQYECVAYTNNNVVKVDGSQEINGYTVPFEVQSYDDGGVVFFSNYVNEYTIKVTCIESWETIEKINPKYLPDLFSGSWNDITDKPFDDGEVLFDFTVDNATEIIYDNDGDPWWGRFSDVPMDQSEWSNLVITTYNEHGDIVLSEMANHISTSPDYEGIYWVESYFDIALGHNSSLHDTLCYVAVVESDSVTYSGATLTRGVWAQFGHDDMDNVAITRATVTRMNKTLDPLYIPPADWNENNSLLGTHIKNRTHYAQSYKNYNYSGDVYSQDRLLMDILYRVADGDVAKELTNDVLKASNITVTVVTGEKTETTQVPVSELQNVCSFTDDYAFISEFVVVVREDYDLGLGTDGPVPAGVYFLRLVQETNTVYTSCLSYPLEVVTLPEIYIPDTIARKDDFVSYVKTELIYDGDGSIQDGTLSIDPNKKYVVNFDGTDYLCRVRSEVEGYYAIGNYYLWFEESLDNQDEETRNDRLAIANVHDTKEPFCFVVSAIDNEWDRIIKESGTHTVRIYEAEVDEINAAYLSNTFVTANDLFGAFEDTSASMNVCCEWDSNKIYNEVVEVPNEDGSSIATSLVKISDNAPESEFFLGKYLYMSVLDSNTSAEYPVCTIKPSDIEAIEGCYTVYNCFVVVTKDLFSTPLGVELTRGVWAYDFNGVFAGSNMRISNIRITDKRNIIAEALIPYSVARTKNTIATPLTAQVGQTIVVKAVDSNGKPIEWECVDMPTDEHINALIDAKLEAIANGTY